MEAFWSILRKHALKYKKMTPCDAVKLAYQSVYGPGHMITDGTKVLEWIEKEYATVMPDREKELIEPIGGVYARLHLSALDPDVIPFTAVQALFCHAAKKADGTLAQWETALKVIRRGTQEGYLPFDTETWDTYLHGYRTAGMGAVHHSDVYREAYQPAYRIIRKEFVPFLPVIGAIYRILAKKGRVVVAIEGMSGSGKSTIAALLSDLCGGEVIHMDDFFLPMEKRTPDRLAEPGGNVDYERFSKEVCPGLTAGESFSYGVYDCSRMGVVDVRRIEAVPVSIVEGSYALHPSFGRYADVPVFLHVQPHVQMERIVRRNGEEMAEKFRSIWIPMENRYFRETHVAERCRYVICNE